MTFVKPPVDGSVKLSGEVSGVGIGEAPASAGVSVEGLGKALDLGSKVTEAGAVLEGLTHHAGASEIGAHVTGIAGGTLAGAVGAVGAVGAAATGLPVGVVGIVAGGGVPDFGGIAAGAVGGAISGAVGDLVSHAMGGVAGQVVSAAAGVFAGGAINATLGGIIGGSTPGIVAGDLPVFEDIAVTGFNPEKAMQGAISNAKAQISGLGGAVASKLGGKNLEVEVGSGDKLEVRQFSIHERLSSLFQVNLVAVSENPSIEFDDVVGQPAKFSMAAGKHDRFWSGVCNHFEQVRVEPTGLSTYQFSIVPTLWLLTQRKNHRMFQHISEPDIVKKLLKEWDIEPISRIDQGAYKKRKYRVQYGESDFTFMSRMLEDAGITFYFEQAGEETKLVLADAPQSNAKRGGSLSFVDDTSMVKSVDLEFVTGVRMGQRVRPGKYTMRDHDYRKPPNYKLLSTASKGLKIEEKLERFQYVPGAFLFGADSGEATPNADDKGKTRTDEKEAAVLAQKRLDAKRGSARVATFETNAHDLAPGVVMGMGGHPHAALGDAKSLLVVESSLSGTDRGEWSHHCEARGADMPFRPELVTPRPKVNGVESATVVGPAGEEIHTDEFGRVRVHFHWDRESKMDDNSSCWIHTSQPWGGAGYGGTNLPRIGQEVLVDFLGGDPDRPVIVGRVYTNLQKTPYKLPENKTQSGIKSNSTGGGGGYNEMMFEDAAGKELVNIQAQKDLNKLVKNNETATIKNNRTKTVWKNDSQLVGVQHSLTIAKPGEGAPAAGPTNVTMVHEKITLTTGKASIVLDGANIALTALGNISLAAGGNIGLSAVTMPGGGGGEGLSQSIAISAEKVVQVDGLQAVFINCTADPPQPLDESSWLSTAAKYAAPVVEALVSGVVGAAKFGASLIGSLFG